MFTAISAISATSLTLDAKNNPQGGVSRELDRARANHEQVKLLQHILSTKQEKERSLDARIAELRHMKAVLKVDRKHLKDRIIKRKKHMRLHQSRAATIQLLRTRATLKRGKNPTAKEMRACIKCMRDQKIIDIKRIPNSTKELRLLCTQVNVARASKAFKRPNKKLYFRGKRRSRKSATTTTTEK